MAVDPAHPRVDVLEDHLLEMTALLPTGIVEVVGVHDANHVVELVGPTAAVMEPVRSTRGTGM